MWDVGFEVEGSGSGRGNLACAAQGPFTEVSSLSWGPFLVKILKSKNLVTEIDASRILGLVSFFF